MSNNFQHMDKLFKQLKRNGIGCHVGPVLCVCI